MYRNRKLCIETETGKQKKEPGTGSQVKKEEAGYRNRKPGYVIGSQV